jgi:hypothetical protein
MADNVTVNAGTFATDDVGGVHYQRIKLDLGGDGVASSLIRGQQSAASALPVVGASDLDGVATDTPSTDEEGAAARTKISLLKGIKNYLRTLAAKQPALGTVGAPSADVLTTQPPASTGSFATVANAAVDAAASTAIDAQATLGKRYARVIVNCDNAHTVRFYGHTADFTAITAVYQLIEYAKTGVAAVSGYGGNAYLVDVSGLAFFCPVVTNDGADASDILVLVAFSD